jgi:hypothetical protein
VDPHSTEAIAATLCLRHTERPVRPKHQAARVVQVRGHLLTIFAWLAARAGAKLTPRTTIHKLEKHLTEYVVTVRANLGLGLSFRGGRMEQPAT